MALGRMAERGLGVMPNQGGARRAGDIRGTIRPGAIDVRTLDVGAPLTDRYNPHAYYRSSHSQIGCHCARSRATRSGGRSNTVSPRAASCT